MNYQLNGVNLIYDKEKEGGTIALRDINVSLERKGLIGIQGPSGSGKSSLLYLMAGLKFPTSGNVFYDTTDLSKLSMSEMAAKRRKDFGFIFQQHFLINYLTVLENTLVPLNINNKTIRNKAMEYLERLGIVRYAHKYPYQLSGGQRQRAAVVRALMNNPKVIFGDEPTAALDHESACDVMTLLTECTDNAMVVIVTHDESLLENADKIISMRDGQITGITEREDTV